MNPQGIFKMLDRLPTGSRRQSGGPSVNNQWPNQDSNLALLNLEQGRIEAGCDFRFTIRPVNKRKARESNPQGPEAARFSKPARQAVSGYLPFQWT